MTHGDGSGDAGALERLRRDLVALEPRALAGERTLRTGLRCAHLAAFGAYYGGHLFAVAPERLGPALSAVLITGFAFALFEVWRSPLFAVQVRGAATALKVALLLASAGHEALRIPLLTLIVVIGGISSHMPSRYRYYSLLHGRVVRSGEKG